MIFLYILVIFDIVSFLLWEKKKRIRKSVYDTIATFYIFLLSCVFLVLLYFWVNRDGLL